MAQPRRSSADSGYAQELKFHHFLAVLTVGSVIVLAVAAYDFLGRGDRKALYWIYGSVGGVLVFGGMGYGLFKKKR